MSVAVALAVASSAACTQGRLQEGGAVRSTTTVDPAGAGVDAPPGIDTAPVRGFRGVRPTATISDEFRRRVLDVDPATTDLVAAAQGYDAVVVAALAAEAARSDATGRVAANVISATIGGRTCLSFLRCRALALTRADYDYDGPSGPIDLQPNGDPGKGRFSIVEYDRAGIVRTSERLEAEAPPFEGRPFEVDPSAGPLGDGVLTIGTLLPVAGPSGDTARGALAGVQVAVDEINDVGGVLSEEIVLLPDESGDGSEAATRAAVDRLLAQGVDVVVGGTVSSITSVALGPVVGAGVLLITPTDTARATSVVPDAGRFFRIAPPSDLESQVLGTFVADNGYTRVAIVRSTDSDGRDAAADVTAALVARGATVTAEVEVAAGGEAAAIAAALDTGPQALVLATPADTAATLLREMVAAGRRPADFATFGVPAAITDDLAVRAAG